MNSPLWTLEEIAVATGARVGGGFRQATGASIDTRTLEPGDLYFAIKGDVHDGHDFVPAAIEKGASGAVVSEEKAPAFASDRLIVVPDVLEAMRQLGRAARKRTDARIVAITGSVGKTGTKEAMRIALSRLGTTHASVASYNNHWGVPLTLSRMPRETEFGIFEIGMNHAQEILPLTAMVRPHVAVVTTIEPVHIEFFPSLWGIADAKGEIFSGLEPGGTAVINRDS
ncbi:MAG TPA: Mur ligase family protein, partial [Microvirga sp.]|nr:Mur ligase family protein [Microvirga sp.]